MKITTTENKKISFDGAGKTIRVELPKGGFFLNSDFKICMHDIGTNFFFVS